LRAPPYRFVFIGLALFAGLTACNGGSIDPTKDIMADHRHVCSHAASCSMSEILSRGSTLVRADCARLRISNAAFTST
jgi:hypothetical protein